MKLGSTAALLCFGPGPVNVVRLDGSFAPVQDAGGALVFEPFLSAEWNRGSASLVVPDGAAVAVHGYRSGRLWPEEQNDRLLSTYAELPADANPVKVGELRVLARIPDEQIVPSILVPLRDRVLVVGTGSLNFAGTLRTAVVWR